MKIPSISIRSMMTCLIVVAVDAVMIRSIMARPQSTSQNLLFLVFATVPMVHVLALGMAWLVRGPIRARTALLGFEIGGGVAVLVTLLGWKRGIEGIESWVEPTAFGRWAGSSPSHELIAQVGFLLGLPFLIQVVTALVTARVGTMVMSRSEDEARPTPVQGRLPIRSLLASLIVVTLPALGVEAWFRVNLDPKIARLVSGTVAVVGWADPVDEMAFRRPGSPVTSLLGVRVRVEHDTNPSVIELVATQVGTTIVGEQIREIRYVNVMIEEGPRSGHSTILPYSVLQPIR